MVLAEVEPVRVRQFEFEGGLRLRREEGAHPESERFFACRPEGRFRIVTVLNVKDAI